MKVLKLLSVGVLALMGAGCNLVVLSPQGDVAAQQGQLIIYATVLMLIVIVPVMALTVFFAWKYRASNKDATYEPDWDHSISLEIVVWSVPLAIIICLAGLTWVATHRLDPYEPLRRISAEQPMPADVEPMVIQVTSLDWKWLFIYPEQGVASVNEAAVIVDRPVEFQLTSNTVMNSFYIPAMAGQIYAMAGMQTELNAVLNEPGDYEGFSANYSGNGFNQMRFTMHAFDEGGFDAWVAKVSSQGKTLDRTAFVALEEASIAHPVTYFSSIETGLWDRIVNMCVGRGKLCQHDMMMVDAMGGGGLAGLTNRYAFAGMCEVDDPATRVAALRATLARGGPRTQVSLLTPGPDASAARGAN
ncbi:MAG: ubiquinol oxidase subunit II [Pseudomonadota bacterium]